MKLRHIARRKKRTRRPWAMPALPPGAWFRWVPAEWYDDLRRPEHAVAREALYTGTIGRI